MAESRPPSADAPSTARRSRGKPAAALIIAVAVLGAAAVWWYVAPPTAAPVVQVDDDVRLPDDPVAVAPGYVGPQACAACHANRVAAFEKTRHFAACTAAAPGKMPPGFGPGKGTFRVADAGLRFEMKHAGDDFVQTSIRTGPDGEKRADARIDLAYGLGGVLDEVYFTWHGDRLYELPIVWLHPQNRWAMTSYNPYGPGGDFARETTPRCLECHNTWMEHVPGTRGEYRRKDLILGVTCEKCHGSARDHVAFHQAHPDADRGHAIVHPGRLARERQIEVCTQCHGNAIYPRGPAFSYRPGQPLDEAFHTIVTRHPEEDHVANQVTYLRRSKCFQKSDRLTCVTCHDPHRPHAPAEPGAGARSCAKCHADGDCHERPRLPTAVRDDCIGCHMPPRVWMNVHFHTEDDRYVPPIRRYRHHIAIDPVARQEVLLAWYRTQSDAASRAEAERLTASLAAHWREEAQRRQKDFRIIAAIGAWREAVAVAPVPENVQSLRAAVATQTRIDADLALGLHQIEQKEFPRAIDTLTQLLRLKPDHAVALGKLGTAYAAAGQTDQAIKQLQAAALDDPNDPYAYGMLGWLAYLDNRTPEALDAFRKAHEIEPANAKVLYHWGLALTKAGRWDDAVDRFRQVRKLDPNHAGACQGIAHALRQLGRPAEALPYAVRADRLALSQNSDVLVTLAETYADLGRAGQADATAARALEAAATVNPVQLAALRLRLAQICARARHAQGP